MLDTAEREHMVEGKREFEFAVRRPSGFKTFYEDLEKELQIQSLFSVCAYRTVKEGYVRVSRPSRLKLTLEALIRRRPHLPSLVKEIEKWRGEFRDLKVDEALHSSYAELTADPHLTRSCFEVLRYLLNNQGAIKGLLPRQVQHAESTKLIRREPLLLRLFAIFRGEPATWPQFLRYFELLERPVEFRFHAPFCVYQKAKLSDFHSVVSQELVNRYDFSNLSGTLIVENLETFFVQAAQNTRRLLLWGSGWKAVLIRHFEHALPRPLVYWGDIDKEGYEIYGQLKSYIPDLKSTLMDYVVIENHMNYAIRKERYFGPYQLAFELQAEYQHVCEQGLCIEQEKIHLQPE